ncbi:hypothetical protein DSO57_1013818 [Entomophthora muscae]|uniref:Uncharacterized protein n=1 Tax=Entomophthora muscae TaxID=34485 RepID=A0ACC2TTC4_9FUNG|nr:hypothetical protein DSO57_1013818 [Entomophthora muscae]
MFFEGLPFILPSPKGWHTLDWHLVENPPDASRVALVPEEEYLLPLESVFVVSDSLILGESEKRKWGRANGAITANAVIVPFLFRRSPRHRM